MSAAPPLQSIAVSGDPLMATLTAAILAARLGHSGCQISLNPSEGRDDATILLRPESFRMLAAFDLPPDRLMAAGAKRVFCYQLNGVTIPITPFGVPRGGVEFHQHLHRRSGRLEYKELRTFNAGLTLGDKALLANAQLPFGLEMASSKLGNLLAAVAKAAGVRKGGASREQADFDITVGGSGVPSWNGASLRIPATDGMPQIAFFRCLRSIERFLNLLPRQGASRAEQAEYNRLADAEFERAEDFVSLLGGRTDRSAVARKIDVFSANGRIPVEDYEVFAPHEWLSALLQTGFTPRDYDRLADRVSRAELERWMLGLEMDLARLKGARPA